MALLVWTTPVLTMWLLKTPAGAIALVAADVVGRDEKIATGEAFHDAVVAFTMRGGRGGWLEGVWETKNWASCAYGLGRRWGKLSEDACPSALLQG